MELFHEISCEILTTRRTGIREGMMDGDSWDNVNKRGFAGKCNGIDRVISVFVTIRRGEIRVIGVSYPRIS